MLFVRVLVVVNEVDSAYSSLGGSGGGDVDGLRIGSGNLLVYWLGS